MNTPTHNSLKTLYWETEEDANLDLDIIVSLMPLIRDKLYDSTIRRFFRPSCKSSHWAYKWRILDLNKGFICCYNIKEAKKIIKKYDIAWEFSVKQLKQSEDEYVKLKTILPEDLNNIIRDFAYGDKNYFKKCKLMMIKNYITNIKDVMIVDINNFTDVIYYHEYFDFDEGWNWLISKAGIKFCKKYIKYNKYVYIG